MLEEAVICGAELGDERENLDLTLTDERLVLEPGLRSEIVDFFVLGVVLLARFGNGSFVYFTRFL